jgi:hypothetical protein
VTHRIEVAEANVDAMMEAERALSALHRALRGPRLTPAGDAQQSTGAAREHAESDCEGARTEERWHDDPGNDEDHPEANEPNTGQQDEAARR